MSVKEAIKTLAIERPVEMVAACESLRYAIKLVESAQSKRDAIEDIFGECGDGQEEDLEYDLIHALELFTRNP